MALLRAEEGPDELHKLAWRQMLGESVCIHSAGTGGGAGRSEAGGGGGTGRSGRRD